MDPDKLLNDSKLNPTGNGSGNGNNNTPPTSGQKWWAAILLGFIFFIISSPAAYYATSWVIKSIGGAEMYNRKDPNLALLLIQTIIFIIIIRILLQ